MKRTAVHHHHRGCHGAGGRRGSLPWMVLGVGIVAALAAAPWMPSGPKAVPTARTAAGDDVRKRAAELISFATSIRLTPEQEKVKAEALAGITAPCGSGSSLAMSCCPCNLGKSIGGLVSRLVAQEGADAPRARQAVLDWIARTNPAGYSGAACERKRCERPFHEDGCGGMNAARVVF